MTQTYHWPDKHRQFAFRAFRQGATMEQSRSWTRPTTTWDVSGNCMKPVRRELSTARVGVPKSVRGKQFATFGERYWTQHIELSVRCRKCDNCRKVRAWQWRLRMKAEVDRGNRTWFTTLTLSPEQHSLARMAAIVRLKVSGVEWAQLHPDEQFAEIVRELGPELTKYVKRVRKNSAARFTYACVTEKHKTGLPHFHMLWHEIGTDSRIKWKQLHSAWRLGFSLHKLIPADEGKKVASYVAKYLSKSLAARVRCSQGYGLQLRDRTASSDRNENDVFPPDPLSSITTTAKVTDGPSSLDNERKLPNGNWRLSHGIPEGRPQVCDKGSPEWRALITELEAARGRAISPETGLSNASEPVHSAGTNSR